MWERRRARLLSLYEQLRPVAIVVELFPFGRAKFARELVPLLDTARRDRRAVRSIASVRDLLVTDKRDQQEHDDLVADRLRRYFDAVSDGVVHGCRRGGIAGDRRARNRRAQRRAVRPGSRLRDGRVMGTAAMSAITGRQRTGPNRPRPRLDRFHTPARAPRSGFLTDSIGGVPRMLFPCRSCITCLHAVRQRKEEASDQDFCLAARDFEVGGVTWRRRPSVALVYAARSRGRRGEP